MRSDAFGHFWKISKQFQTGPNKSEDIQACYTKRSILGCNHPKDPCHWDEIIPMDGGWLPHWDEALDESTGIIEAVYFAF